MKWNGETFGDYRQRVQEWHPVFAWLPVFCAAERRTVWLERVERRATAVSFDCGESWEYRASR